MVRVTGPRIIDHGEPIIKAAALPRVQEPPSRSFSLGDFGADMKRTAEIHNSGDRVRAGVMNAERPSNLWYRTSGMSTYWYMYSLMDLYASEVSILSTLFHRSTTELFRYGLELSPKFAKKCTKCGYECQTLIDECPQCGSTHLRRPDASQKDYFRRPNGKSFLDEANDSGQSMKDVLKAYAFSEYQNNQAYTLCITGDIVDKETGHLLRAYPLEFIPEDPKFVRYLYDETGKPGTDFAFTRDDRNTLINLNDDPDALEVADERGYELYPAVWQVGSNFGGTGRFWLYTQEEVYQDKWFKPSLIYGIPHWFDIEDDILTYHYIEKHNLKKYKFGITRKLLLLPGFNDEDVEDITKGIRDVLATNDNSIPIVCTPPAMPGVSEMQAQVLELGDDDASILLSEKDDIRDRICAHGGVPNLWVGDVEQSGGMNNESQQITTFDRYLMDKYEAIDRQCRWIMSWFPQITDWELTIVRPGKASEKLRKRMDQIQEAQGMQGLGFTVEIVDGDFRYSSKPAPPQMDPGMAGPPGPDPMAGPPIGEDLGPSEGLPDPGAARRDDPDVDDAKSQTEESQSDAASAMMV